MAISRLLSPRRLSPGVKYCAFVVPTHLLGVEAALGVEATETHRGQLA
ncbi:MAG: hypothetical protein IPO07_23135 [Haliscomenobacter sp.]|nr:hypothetical protein [Haliscomenobacter sp.]MBK9491363.1 hypothetical protein [Haliscomenobacter sp.]